MAPRKFHRRFRIIRKLRRRDDGREPNRSQHKHEESRDDGTEKHTNDIETGFFLNILSNILHDEIFDMNETRRIRHRLTGDPRASQNLSRPSIADKIAQRHFEDRRFRYHDDDHCRIWRTSIVRI